MKESATRVGTPSYLSSRAINFSGLTPERKQLHPPPVVHQLIVIYIEVGIGRICPEMGAIKGRKPSFR